jgi:chitin synthase
LDEVLQLLIGMTILLTSFFALYRDNRTQAIDEDPRNPNAYLYESLHLMIVNKVDSDATAVYNELFATDDFLYCLDELFFEARIDDRYDKGCNSIGVLMYVFLFFVVGMQAIQVLCSMIYLFRSHRIFADEDLQAAVMVMVPCYNEGEVELRKTINSVLMTAYPGENKCLVIVADGVITGHGEKYSTPEICANILEFEVDYDDDPCYHYRSVGKMRDNYASIYTGTFEKEVDEVERTLKYIVIVKRGGPEERTSDRPGNRGKRDSQLVISGMLNRIHHNREPEELDMALVKALFSVGLPAKDVEYLMCIDADTRVHEESISHMIYSMEQNKNVLACCGETQVDNKAQSWVTMIQIFEYYSSHHLKKAFESVFGCVTCLPGCFTM